MEYFNALNQVKRIEPKFYLYILQKSAQLIAPLAPHFAEEIWSMFRHRESIFKSSWPVYDPDAVISEQINIVVQVNGKVREQILVDSDATQELIEKMAMESDKVQKFVQGKTIVKMIHVPGKLINIVVK
jgi:leucyl-tRNA synthetase